MTLYMPLFRACTTSRSLAALHAHLTVSGFGKDPLVATKLIEAYSQAGSEQSSRMVFSTFPNPDSFMWGVLIKSHVRSASFQEAIDTYQTMLESSVELSKFVFPTILRACSAIDDLRMGEKVHSTIVKSGFELDPIIDTSLLNLYGESGCLCSARKVFDKMPVKDIVSWSSIITNYVRNGSESEGLELFTEMVRQGVKIDSVTMLSVVEACGELGLQKIGSSCHGYIVRRDILIDHEALVSSLIAMYAKFGNVCSAEMLFRNGDYRTVASWTALISCYNQNGYHLEALQVFIEMVERNVEINTVTLMNILCSCARLRCVKEGKSIHGYVVRNHIELDKDFLRSSLIDLYANSGSIGHSRLVFDAAKDKHVVSWNILISGYAREDKPEEAILLFQKMLIHGVLPDSFALASSLSACGAIGMLEFGCQLHSLIIKTFIANEFVKNALIDMYSKCGFPYAAFKIFGDAREEGSVVTWNSMISGFSKNGYSKEALNLFNEMYVESCEMDGVTFLGTIQACSDVGFIENGKWIHHKLIMLDVKNDMYINTALVNMYSRCGDLDMARRIFNRMSNLSIVSWSSMIGGYAMHGQVDESIFLFDRMVESGIRPNDITFMNILLACSHAGYVEKGKLYFESMIQDFGIVPNSEHYACLVDLLSRTGDLKGAYKMIRSMPVPAEANVWGMLVNGCRIHQRMDFLSDIKNDIVNMNADDSGYYTLLANVYAEGGKWREVTEVKTKMRSLALKKVHGRSMIEVESNR